MKAKFPASPSVSLGALQSRAEAATSLLKSAKAKLEAAEAAFAVAEHDHAVAMRALNDGIKSVAQTCKPQV